MRVGTRDGVALHVQEIGSGPPVVMVHGMLLGTLASWYLTVAPALASRHRVVLYDLRGHGLSDRVPTGYDVATMTDDLEAVIEEVVREPAVVVGHSYGGVIALELALRRPEHVRKIVVVEAPLPASRLEELDESFRQTLAAANDRQSQDAALEMLPDVMRERLAGGRRRERFADSMRFLATSTLYYDMRREEDIPDAVLARLDLPLLAIYGTRSKLRTVGARFAHAVPGARLVELEGGHFLPLEQTGAVAAAISEFVDG
jgi:pimeloyl-ACP methyl ester carboxylesterase